MIPIKLTLRNFMSYGDEPTTLPFEGLHVACLSGDNGNGKSALLDAITWALWDKTRASAAGAASADDLIRIGASETEVRFEFEINGGRFRVTRKRKRGKTGGDWQLAQKNSAGDYVAAGGNSSRETGRQIVKLLNMEYETFVNSCYLQQGRADSFTRQKPADRKRILAEILGLELYERLEAKAKEQVRKSKAALEGLEWEMNSLQAAADRLPQHQQDLAEAQERCERWMAETERREAEVRNWQQRGAARDALKSRQDEAFGLCRQTENALAVAQRAVRSNEEAQREAKRTLTQREAILADYQQLKSYRERRDKLHDDAQEYLRVEADRQQTANAIEQERIRREGDVKLLMSQWSAAQRRESEALQQKQDVTRLQEALAGANETSERLERERQTLQTVVDEFATLKTSAEQVKERIKEVEEALEVLSAAGAACPICNTELNQEKRERVTSRQRERLETLRTELERLKREGLEARRKQTELQAEISRLEAEKSRQQNLQAQLSQAQKRLVQIAEESANDGDIKRRLDDAKRELDAGAFAEPKRAQLNTLDRRRASLEQTKREYDDLSAKIRRLDGAEGRYQKILDTETSLAKLEGEAEIVRRQQTDAQNAKERADANYQEIERKLAAYMDVERQAREAERLLSEARTQQSRAQGDVTAQERYIQDCHDASGILKTKKEERKDLAQNHTHYNMLATAFGKRGIQNMIIDNTLPEIQDEANELLGRLTDGAMKLTLTTLRDRRSGDGAIETLDINITDDAGMRPYELFSGGEGFRANFALRLALSRLLARRSGAKLETLILDEGFGSQDGKGRERLVEAIEAVKEDFQKILVITHFEDVKDSFSQRIEVVKDAGGSRIHLF